jgi:hypothetical protein
MESRRYDATGKRRLARCMYSFRSCYLIADREGFELTLLSS